MKIELTKETVENVFKQTVNESLIKEKSLDVYNALQLVTDFYHNYEIRDVDLSVPDNDMLLFEYGIYDWDDGKGENYTIGITRQFYIETGDSDGFSQLHLTLYYNHEEFKKITSTNKWSIDFESADEWKNFVMTTEGFKLAKSKPIKSFDIYLTETD